MKRNNRITTILLLFFVVIKAQTGIETTAVEPSVLLRFPDGSSRGITLPQVKQPVGSSGTILFDIDEKKIKLKKDEGWTDLSPVGATLNIDFTGKTESSAPTIIGATSSSAQGALILESQTKAMVLPRVANPEQTMINPPPGTICFDTVSKMIAVYDGVQWSFWK